MAKEVKLTCDCGCNAEAIEHKSKESIGWLTLSQENPDTRGDGVKLTRTLHFISLDCLAEWSRRAAKTVPSSRAAARGLHPRGKIQDPKVPEIYI